MIRWKMGDSLFFKAVNDYQNFYAGGFAGTADFERFMSQLQVKILVLF
jgi:hypothetical protein